ncbi:MAG: tRNA (N(6)-L-threonylcarbamoyladenosine(37)-C(2))-methylthiotransferase MtaB [Cyclobacteriaceae bacterium]|nr:tRNA (N(6)-L-threonylcarbamoyladenosine(37)-C(2))-methylthiotransferase MtaB [Cyclobacteriaceae bacterium]MCH8517211.1 tRNA (N(6)-L-threonylcarbamoyladenosine(37)-C(2))-methylthiotransferase MtaB [Cyclobacteriaceae bacterium]
MSKKVAFYTLGCKLNFSETSSISRKFEEKGFKKVDFSESADIYIINTCSVTENADKKCKKLVKDINKKAPNAFVGIIGCYAQLKPKEIASIPGVDAVLGAAEKFKLVDLLDGFIKRKEAQIFAGEIKEVSSYNAAWSINDRTRTFLKVQDGCNYHCTFCTIPLARGKSRSDTIENIVKAANEIGDSGVKEIVLTGVNIGDYGIIEGKRQTKFIELVKALDKVDTIDRFRISSIEPNLLSNDIIDFVSQSQRFVPHFHIPLQSGSNTLLRKMRRRYLRELYSDRIARIKTVMPNACIGVDVIVGFPGETEELFLETYHFLNELDISYLHVFTYSERANTPAEEMEGVVPVKVRNERSKMLRILSEKKKRAFYEDQANKVVTVLFEDEEQSGRIYGFSENYVRISKPFDPMSANKLETVMLSHLSENNVYELEPDEVTV